MKSCELLQTVPLPEFYELTDLCRLAMNLTEVPILQRQRMAAVARMTDSCASVWQSSCRGRGEADPRVSGIWW